MSCLTSPRLWTPLLLVFVLSITADIQISPLWGQTTSTEILGRVSDASGAVIPGATVTITRTATGESRTATTNQAGDYTFPLIEVGLYTVRCESAGFRSSTVTGLRVETQQKARVDFTMQIGEVTEKIEVAASAVALQTEDASIGSVVENKRVVDLPLNGRNITNLAVMTPGLQFGSRTGLADGQGGFPIPGTGISVIANGQREINQSVTIDGVEAIMPLYNHTAFTPSVDALEEFKVMTSSYSAEFGQGAGAHIQVTMKGGTNQFHGTMFNFLRNEKLDAETYFLNFELAPGASWLPKDRLRRNQFGTFLSGPIIRNKTFWSFNYEGRRQMSESVGTAWWPNQEFRRGDFSALLNPAVNPKSGSLYRAPIVIYDALTGMPFGNNQIPSSRLHRGAQTVIEKYLPMPDFQQTDILDFTARRTIPVPINSNQYFGRIDHNFSEKDRVFGRANVDYSDWHRNNINPNFPDHLYSTSWNLATQWLHVFSPTVVNEFRFGTNYWGDEFLNPRSETDFDPDSLGIGKFRVATDNNRKLTPMETGIPSIGFTIGDAEGRFDDTYNHQFADSLSIITGKHNLKTGFQYNRVTLDRFAANLSRGNLSFGANESGFAFASFLLGYPAQSSTAEGLPGVNLRQNRTAAYITDDWRVTSRLTVNMGFRWDYYGNSVDSLGGLRTPDFGIRAPWYTGPNGEKIPTIYPASVRSAEARVKIWQQSPGFFQPRLGIAYRPLDKWVIRMGAGQFSSVQLLVNTSHLNLVPPLSGFQQLNAVTDAAGSVTVPAGGRTYTLPTRKFRSGITPITLDDPFGGGVARTSALSIRYMPDDRKDSDVWQWSFDIQRELPYSTAFTIGYVGSKNTHVPNNDGAFNQATPSPDTNFQPRRRFPYIYDPAQPEKGIQSLGAVSYYGTYGNGFYHGLQAKLEKRYANGISYGLAYTFSKSHGDGEDGANEGSGLQNINDRLGSRGRRAFDQRHAAVFHWVWALPFGKSLRGVPAAVLKGWQTNGIVTLRTGFPFTPAGGDLNTGGGDIRPDRLRDGALENPTRQLWFDPTAFQRVTCNIPSRPDLCHFGNSGRGILDTPGQRNLDVSAFKDFQITERFSLQFRAEFFNALNTPYFGAPNNLSYTSVNAITPDGPRVGEIRGLRTSMRIVQLALKLYF
ncbi:MAG: TonB-dependent receptor [Bryobacterales bacterium]|nr:TonB-dependent receptor [Bryobacterales bacterium]